MEALKNLRTYLSPNDYLKAERESDLRHEYLDGQVYAMAGESPEHSTICTNLTFVVVGQLKGKPCREFSPNMKVRTPPKNLFVYPDLTVVCGEPVFHDERRDVLTNPKVIFEVLSPSTEAYDRGGKWIRYQQIETLSDYILIAQDEPQVEHFARQPDGKWLYTTITDLVGILKLPSIECQVSLAELYERIVFPEQPTVME